MPSYGYRDPHYNYNYHEVITTIFSTWHDSGAIMAFAKVYHCMELNNSAIKFALDFNCCGKWFHEMGPRAFSSGVVMHTNLHYNQCMMKKCCGRQRIHMVIRRLNFHENPVLPAHEMTPMSEGRQIISERQNYQTFIPTPFCHMTMKPHRCILHIMIFFENSYSSEYVDSLVNMPLCV